jgi:bifunctional UDP-N-acetylglucosamine pyrophosphorylase/glucosamine-1-phosphate N-acetyltransferase
LTIPKPLLPVQNRPLLDWTIAGLPSSVDRLLVVTHYLADQIQAYLSHQKHVLDWVAIPQGTPRGTGDALRKCQSYVQSDRFLVINGDDLFGAADLARLAHTPAGVICQVVADPRKWGIAFLKADGALEKLVEKPDLEGPQLANTGAYLFPKSVFELEIGLSPRGEYEITDFVSQLAARAPFHVVKATFWYPIGTEEAWQKAQTLDLASVLTRTE